MSSVVSVVCLQLLMLIELLFWICALLLLIASIPASIPDLLAVWEPMQSRLNRQLTPNLGPCARDMPLIKLLHVSGFAPACTQCHVTK